MIISFCNLQLPGVPRELQSANCKLQIAKCKLIRSSAEGEKTLAIETARLRFECGALSDPEQPIGDHLARSNRHRFAGQNKESCLKRILGILVMRHNSP